MTRAELAAIVAEAKRLQEANRRAREALAAAYGIKL